MSEEVDYDPANPTYSHFTRKWSCRLLIVVLRCARSGDCLDALLFFFLGFLHTDNQVVYCRGRLEKHYSARMLSGYVHQIIESRWVRDFPWLQSSIFRKCRWVFPKVYILIDNFSHACPDGMQLQPSSESKFMLPSPATRFKEADRFEFHRAMFTVNMLKMSRRIPE